MSNTSATRYDRKHRTIRARWQRDVEAGQVRCHAIICLMPSRWIQPDEPWDMGHTPDGTTHTGPEHTRCNRSEGATRGNRGRRHKGRPNQTNWPLP